MSLSTETNSSFGKRTMSMATSELCSIISTSQSCTEKTSFSSEECAFLPDQISIGSTLCIEEVGKKFPCRFRDCRNVGSVLCACKTIRMTSHLVEFSAQLLALLVLNAPMMMVLLDVPIFDRTSCIMYTCMSAIKCLNFHKLPAV